MCSDLSGIRPISEHQPTVNSVGLLGSDLRDFTAPDYSTQTVSDLVGALVDWLDPTFTASQSEDCSRIRAFMRQYPIIPCLLLDAEPHLRRYFGPQVRVNLRLLYDPDASNGEPMLYAHIETELPAGEKVRQLDRLEDEWWIDASREAGWPPLSITV